jgi:peptidoglycan hydrolase-like protein with peptidoglycan-binding domain
VKYYEGQLLLSARLKKEGVNNADVKSYQDDGITKGEKLNQDRKERLFALFGNVSNTVKLGDNGPLVFEIQKLLKSKGQDVIVDGVFKEMTAKAILTFEQEQKLYPDGKLDVFTFEKLLE